MKIYWRHKKKLRNSEKLSSSFRYLGAIKTLG